METIRKKLDRYGNDPNEVKRIIAKSEKTWNLNCTIHKKLFKKHSFAEHMEDYNISGFRIQKSQGHIYHTDQIKTRKITNLKDLIKNGIGMHDLEAVVADNCKHDFQSKIDYLSYGASILLEILEEMMNKSLNIKLKWIAVLIGIKNLRALKNSTHLTCNGYYEDAMVLLRPFLENYLLLNYLYHNTDIIDEYYDGKLKIKSKALVICAGDKMWSEIWKLLCDNYLHSNPSSLHTIVEETKNPESSIITMLPKYDREKSNDILDLSMLLFTTTLSTIGKIFVKDVKNHEQLCMNIFTLLKTYEKIINDSKLQIKPNYEEYDIFGE